MRHIGKHTLKIQVFGLPRISDMGRIFREYIKKPLTKTVQKTRLVWSVWREAMVPHNVGIGNPKLYAVRSVPAGFQKQHYYNQNTRQQLARRCPERANCSGIYELGVGNNNRGAVVYIGSTHRRAGRSIYKRISEYLTDGSHISEIIQRALGKGFKIYVRWMKIKPYLVGNRRKLAEELENDYLRRYNYAWNDRENDGRREIFGIGVAL